MGHSQTQMGRSQRKNGNIAGNMEFIILKAGIWLGYESKYGNGNMQMNLSLQKPDIKSLECCNKAETD